MMVESKKPGAFPCLQPVIHLFFCWDWRGLHQKFLLLCVILLPFAKTLPCTGEEEWAYHANTVQDFLRRDDGLNLANANSNEPGCYSLTSVCSRSDSFCFPSILQLFLCGDDKHHARTLETSKSDYGLQDSELGRLVDNADYKLSDATEVTCSVIDTDGTMGDRSLRKLKEADGINDNLCEGQLPPESWMQGSSGRAVLSDQESLQSSLMDVSLSPHVEINPPILEWDLKQLYTASLASLSVTNKQNDSILHVYEPYSSNLQFYVHNFRQLSINPGQTAVINFVFLPTLLGSSSAHIVLQTSYGGFIVHAKGKAVESHYRIQPLVGFDVSRHGRLEKNVSLYNPFDDVLYVEEVMAYVSVVSGNTSHSSRVVCQKDALQQFSRTIRSSLDHTEFFNAENCGHASSWVHIMPKRKWEVLPHLVETILEVNLLPHVVGNVSGVICMRLQGASLDKFETIMVPLEDIMHPKIGYHVSEVGSISFILEPLEMRDDKGSTFLLSLRNSASQLFHVAKVVEVTDSEKIFKIRYAEGLILYPQTLTKTAFITYDYSSESHSSPTKFLCEKSNCVLRIVTNESVNSQIEIPCQNLVFDCSRHEAGIHSVSPKGPSVELNFNHNESANGRTKHSESTPEHSFSVKDYSIQQLHDNVVQLLSSSVVAEADELMLRNWKNQGTMTEMSVLEDRDLMFQVVEVGSHHSKWINVKNPSQKPVIMQLLLSSGSIIDHCKPASALSGDRDMTRFTLISSTETSDGFSVSKSAIIEVLVHPSERASFGPIVFHPSDRCMWRSSALIRNNLSGVEWLPLQGIGGSRSLVLFEDSKPVEKLEFTVDWPMSLNLSSPEPVFRREQVGSTCRHSVSKELFVKNAGDLSLEILKLEISGASCGLDGFTIHACQPFSLSPGETTKIHLSYQADFSAAVIQRDLELGLASGIIVIPMKANIPIYMMKLCKKSFVGSLLKISPLVIFVLLSMVVTFFCFLTHIFTSTSEDYVIKCDKTTSNITKVGNHSRIHQNPRNCRSDREVLKPDVDIVSGRSNTKRNNDINGVAKPKLVCQDETLLLRPCSEEKIAEEAGGSGIKAPEIGNLTVKIVREKGKRRKRRSYGMLAGKFEVSSSQSGNSTPSSPLSPNVPTPKQVWPSSPSTLESRVTERNHDKDKTAIDSIASLEPVVAKYKCSSQEPVIAQGCLSVPTKSSMKPVLLPSATFPASGCRLPSVAAPRLPAATSPIPQHARAPGSRLGQDKLVKRDHVKEFTYDIWGNHLTDHIMGRSNELSPRPVSDASEGESLSFFAKGPQSLVRMSSARSVSPHPNPPCYDVNYNYKMV